MSASDSPVVVRDIAVTPRSPSLESFAAGDDSSGGARDPPLLLRRAGPPALAWGGQGADWELSIDAWLDTGVLDTYVPQPYNQPAAASAELRAAEDRVEALRASLPLNDGTLRWSIPGIKGLYGDVPVSGLQPSDEARISFNVSLTPEQAAQVVPWMPNGFGEQQLYDLQMHFIPAGAPEPEPASIRQDHDESMATLSDLPPADGSLSVRFGFRVVELVQSPLPGGRSYFFRVNGQSIPVRGSNFVPLDAIENRGGGGNTSWAARFVRGLRDSG